MKPHLEALGAGDGNNIVSLAENPSKRNLTCGRIVFRANLLELVGEGENLREVLLRVTRDHATEVVCLEVFWPFLKHCKHAGRALEPSKEFMGNSNVRRHP